MGSSSKKVTVGYKYYVGMHMILHHGTADKLSRIRVEDKDILSSEITISGSGYIDKPDIFGGESREGGIQGDFDFETGLPTQSVNSYLSSKLGEYVTAFRGVTAVVLRQMYMGMNPYLKPWAFRAKRIHKRFDNQVQWYDEKAEIIAGVQLNTTPYASYDFDLDAVENATISEETALSIGYTITVNSPDDVLLITLPGGRTYSAYTYEGQPIKNEVYNSGAATELRAKRNDGAISDAWVGIGYYPFGNNSQMASGLEAARAAFETQQMTGATKYTFYIYDSPVSSNTGGLSPHIDVYQGGGNDMNPAHIIRECLTDPDWGMGYQDADIDDNSFIAAADVLYNERMGISILWDTQTSIEEFVKEIIKHIDAALYVDRRSGKFVLKLVRFDFDEAELIVLDESNIDKITDFKRPAFGELINSVTVTFWDFALGEESTLTVSDIALAQQQGNTNLTSLKYQGFSNANIASRVAQRDLKQLSTPLVTCTVYTNRDADELNIGSVFKLNWPDYDINNLVMRVTGIAYGDGKSNRIRIQCAQDVFSLPDEAYIPESPAVWEDPSALPVPVENQLAFEVPYLELVQAQGQTQVNGLLSTNPNAGYVAAAATRPVNSTLYCRLFTDNGAGYEEAGQVDFSPSAVLSEDISETQETFDVSNTQDFEEIVIGSWFQIGNELMGYLGITGSTVEVQRGVLDTVPAKHEADEVLIFWDYYAEADPTEYVESDEVSVKLATVSGSGQLALEDASVSNVVLNSRAIRPYAPGNVKINGEYFPYSTEAGNTTITWAHRDRQQQTAQALNDFFDENIGPEAGTTYILRIYGETDILGRTVETSSTSYTYSTLDELADFQLSGSEAGGAWTPAAISLSLWLDANDAGTVSEDSGAVSQWDDKSGNSYNFSQPSSSAQPSIETLGGKNVVSFDGVSEYLSIDESLFYALSEHTTVAVIYVDSGSSGDYWLAEGSSTNNTPVYGPGRTDGWPFMRNNVGGTVLDSPTDAPYSDSTWKIWGYEETTEEFHKFVNAPLTPSASHSHSRGTLTLDTTSLGALVRLSAALHTPIKIAEVVTYSGTSNTDRQKLEGYLAHKWGLQANLPVDHPYKTEAPTTSYRQNGKLRFELESIRNDFVSFQKHNITVLREGYGFNYGESYGN